MTTQTSGESSTSARTVLVTGGSKGIGRAIAERLHAAGHKVAATYRSGDVPPGVLGVECDVTDAAQVDAAFGQVEAALGPVEVVVANAGITRDTLIMRMSDEDWDAVIATNLTSVFRLSKGCLKRMMKERRGRIVSLTSIVGLTGNPGQTNYAAAKAGILGFTKSLAKEIASRGVTVNAVAPGFIDTDMTRALNDEQRAALTAQVPMARLGSVDDIAAAVLFLCGPGASYITGETLHVNGGMYMA